MSESAMPVFNRRIAVWNDTLATAPTPVAKSVKVAHEPGFAMPPRFPRTDVRVVDADTIDAAQQLAESTGRRPLVLNLADDCFPGGCVYTGSGAQEESLFRRTGLCRTLTMHFYPIRDGEAVYSPGVAVLKASEAQGFARQAPPLPTLDFLACPALRHPQLDASGSALREEDVARLEVKVETVLQAAYKNGHGALVLGAMGCGAWRNPPHHVAQIMRRVLERYPGAFADVHIAVLRDADRGVQLTRLRDRADNLSAFQAAFGQAPQTLEVAPPTLPEVGLRFLGQK
jgi:uncharacterized protein (TIGR02452 family)